MELEICIFILVLQRLTRLLSALPQQNKKKRERQRNTCQVNINTFGPHKIWQMLFNIGVRPVRSHAAASSLVRGLTNWFSDHSGARLRHVMVYPRAEESESNLKHWISVTLLTNLLQSIRAGSERLPVTRIISRIPQGEDNWQLLWVKMAFPSFLSLARCLLQISVNAYLQSWPSKSNRGPWPHQTNVLNNLITGGM